MDTPTDDQAGPALAAPADNQDTEHALIDTHDPLAVLNNPAPAPTMTVPEEDDVIDSAWIEKVKQIVLATAGDPHKQSQQLAAVKAEYLQKRYNKSVNTNAKGV